VVLVITGLVYYYFHNSTSIVDEPKTERSNKIEKTHKFYNSIKSDIRSDISCSSLNELKKKHSVYGYDSNYDQAELFWQDNKNNFIYYDNVRQTLSVCFKNKITM